MNLSKKHQLKNYLRIFVLLLGVSALLWNCEKEDIIIEPTETVEIQEHPKINVKMVTLEHLQQKEVLNDKLKNIVTALDISKNNLDGNKNNYAQSRISSTDNSFVILTDDILEVTTDSTETYTFRIETPTGATSTFENFVIEKVDDTYLFSITKLIKIEDSEADFPYTMTRQSISEEQINLEDFDDILKNTMYYDASTGCYWYTYSSNALARGDKWAIYWCPETGGGGPGGPPDPNDTGNSTDTHDYDSSDPDGNGDNSPGNGGTGTNTTDPTADPIIDPNSPIGVLPSIDDIQPSCKSFNFQKTASLWQEAAVKGIYFHVYLIAPDGIRYKYTIDFPQPVLFGSPTNLVNGGNLSSNIAATSSANALGKVMSKIASEYGNTNASQTQVKSAFRDELTKTYSDYIPGGRVQFNATSFTVTPTEYVSGFYRDNCN